MKNTQIEVLSTFFQNFLEKWDKKKSSEHTRFFLKDLKITLILFLNFWCVSK